MNPDLTPRSFLTDFLLEQIAAQPLDLRLHLYRALAADTQDVELRDACISRAREIEALRSGERQMRFDFQRRAR
jgi:hypothetical protein